MAGKLSDEILAELKKGKGKSAEEDPEDVADGGADEEEEGDYEGDEAEALKEMGEALKDEDYGAAGEAFRNALRICVPKVLADLKK